MGYHGIALACRLWWAIIFLLQIKLEVVWTIQLRINERIQSITQINETTLGTSTIQGGRGHLTVYYTSPQSFE